MNKDNLISTISEKTHIPHHIVENVTNAFFSQIIDTTSRGEQVTIRGFGSFCAKTIAPRNFISVNNNVISSPEHKKPLFKPSKDFINRLNHKSR